MQTAHGERRQYCRSADRPVMRAARFGVRWPVVVANCKLGDAPGKLVNVGATGGLFITRCHYGVGDCLEIDIYPTETGPGDVTDPEMPIRCVVRVVSRRPAPDGLFAFGARFCQISPDSAARLSDSLVRLYTREISRCAEAASQIAPVRFHRLRG